MLGVVALATCYLLLGVLLHTHSLTPRQCRAARAAVGVSRQRLADLAKLDKHTVQNFENGAGVHVTMLYKLVGTLEGLGIEFLSNGITFRPSVIKADERELVVA